MSAVSLRINCHDPRGHQPFLELSYDLQRWQAHANDRSWWIEREKQCNTLFQQYGYDLQSGVWHCLIACQRSGWSGIASASSLLANGFIRHHTACWPPLAAVELRGQILESYSRQLIPQIYALPLTAVSAPVLEQLLNASNRLLDQAKALPLTQPRALEQLNAWLENQIRALKQRTIMNAVLSPLPPPPSLHSSPLQVSVPREVMKPINSVWLRRAGWIMLGAGTALCATLVLQRINDPQVLRKSQQLWPSNPLVSSWQRRQEAISSNLRINNSTQQMSQHLEVLEQRLLDAEQKRKPYMTISELKTTVYTLQETLNQQSSMVENKLNQLALQKKQHQRLSPAAVLELTEQLDALKSRLLLLEGPTYINSENIQPIK